MKDIWFWSVVLNVVGSLAVVYFAVALSHGAGFSSWPALLRLTQRVALCFLAYSMLDCALHQIQVKAGPPIEWFVFQVAYAVCLIVSVLRHWSAPAIPRWANWHNRIVLEPKRK